MKKTRLLLIIFFLSVASFEAQDFQFGVKPSVKLLKVTGMQSEKYVYPVPNFHLLFNLTFNDKYSMEFSAGYSFYYWQGIDVGVIGNTRIIKEFSVGIGLNIHYNFEDPHNTWKNFGKLFFLPIISTSFHLWDKAFFRTAIYFPINAIFGENYESCFHPICGNYKKANSVLNYIIEIGLGAYF